MTNVSKKFYERIKPRPLKEQIAWALAEYGATTAVNATITPIMVSTLAKAQADGILKVDKLPKKLTVAIGGGILCSLVADVAGAYFADMLLDAADFLHDVKIMTKACKEEASAEPVIEQVNEDEGD